ncbi:MAG: IS256 family transposase [Burkholderiales bacterium]
MAEDRDFLRPLVQAVLQELLEAEMTEVLGAEKGERSVARLGYRSGYYDRTLVSRVGKLELRVPQDREGRFSTELFERYARAEKALLAALCEMYVQGVSTRKVKAITEELVGHSFSASSISAIVKRLDGELERFMCRQLAEPFPYLIVDARYEKVRVDHVIRDQAVMIAIGIGWDGRRQVLGIEVAHRESAPSWSAFLRGLKERGLHGVEFVVSDDHDGLKRAIRETLTGCHWQRCYVHFLRNALDHLPRKGDEECLQELRWMYDRRSLKEAKSDLAAWIKKWGGRYAKLVDWVEENIEQTFTYFALPALHHKHMKSTNMLERFNEEIKRRTRVVRIFPNQASCLRLIRALGVERHETWQEDARYLNMDLLAEQKKEGLKVAA